MGKRNRNKNKKKKESDGSTGNVNGESSNINDNNNNNDITNSAVATTTTTTTTIVLTTEVIEYLDNNYGLKGYPKSKDFVIGYRHYAANQEDLAIASLKRGVENDSCVPCMFFYVNIQHQRGNFHLIVPYALEGAIREHTRCMNILISCYNRSEPAFAIALSSFWLKLIFELGDTRCTEEERKEFKKISANKCVACGKEESEDNDDGTLVKCGICKYYSYCGKNCQTYHWKEHKHMNECRQVILLRKYCKPQYVKEIRDATIGGQDPKEIHTLQRLRMKLGLNRPKEEYEELLVTLANDDNNNNNNNKMKRGTKVKIKGLVKASEHNGKFGIVTKILTPGEGGCRRVGIKLLDESGTVHAIKIENLESTTTTTTQTTTTTNRLNPLEYLIARKDGTVHIGSTAHTI